MGDTLMAYGTLLTDAVQSSTANTPPQFNDGNGTQVGTLCRAWVNFNGTLTGTNPPRASFNVSSVARNGTGDYTVNFTNAMPDVNYTITGVADAGGSTIAGGVCLYTSYSPSTTSARINSYSIGSSANALMDKAYINVAIFR